MNQSTRLSHALSYWAAEARGDLASVLNHFSPTASFAAPGFSLNGREEIAQFYRKIMGAYASMRVEARRTIELGDDLVVEFGFHYTRHDGAKGYAEGCNVFTISNGLIVRLRAYFNPAEY